jgi:chromosome segregation ATPase
VSINEEQESLCSKLSELQQTKDDLEARMTEYKVELKSTSREQQSSNRRLREVLKLKRDTTQRLRELESTMGHHEGRLKAAEDEARVLRRGSIDDAVRIIQLECQNAELAEQLQQSSFHYNEEAHSITIT